jgi:hypothetical protein
MSTDLAKLPPEFRARVSQELSAGERVLYAAMPDWRAGLGAGLGIFLFGVGWSAISFTMFALSAAAAFGFMPAETKTPGPGTAMAFMFVLFLVPFVLVGIACLATPFYIAHRNRFTVHVATDHRVMSVCTRRRSGADSYALDRIIALKRRDWKDGRGNLSIGYGFDKDSDGDARALTLDWGGIADVRRAEAVIRAVSPHLRRSD